MTDLGLLRNPNDRFGFTDVYTPTLDFTFGIQSNAYKLLFSKQLICSLFRYF